MPYAFFMQAMPAQCTTPGSATAPSRLTSALDAYSQAIPALREEPAALVAGLVFARRCSACTAQRPMANFQPPECRR
jgi:hypothetical protein